MAELMQDEDMTLQSFLEVLEHYGIEKNRSAGDIYLELLSLRREMRRANMQPSAESIRRSRHSPPPRS